MKVTVKKKDLAGALSQLRGVCGGRQTLPILGCVLMGTDSAGRLVLSGNNLDTALRLTIAAEVPGEGFAAAVGLARLSSAVGEMTGETVSLEADGQKLTCTSGGQTLRLLGLPVEDFPECPPLDKDAEAVQFQGGWLKERLGRVLFCVSSDETRYVLNGVLFSCTAGGGLVLVSTDGRRLMKVTSDIDAGACAAILPKAACKLLAALDAGEELVTLRFGENQVEATVAGGAWALSSKLIEGTFPNYEQVIPGKMSRQIVVDRAELLRAVGFAGTVLTEGADSVRLEANLAGDLMVEGAGPDVGEASQTIAASVTGGAWAVAYNAKFLAEALRHMTGEEVTLEMEDGMSPTKMVEADALTVLMPMRIS